MNTPHRPHHRLPAAVSIAALLAAGLVFQGCAANPSRPMADMSESRSPAPPVEPDRADPISPRTVTMLDGHTGSPISWLDLTDRAVFSDAVLIGEMHGHRLGLAVAAALFEDVLAHPAGGSAALALEFISRDEQVHLDDYLAGLTDEEAFRKAASRTDGNYPEGHSTMVEAARTAGRPVVAANAPRRYVRLARMEGLERLDALTAEQRRLVESPYSLTEGRYREQFFSMMSAMPAHGPAGADEAELTEEQKQRRKDEMILSFFTSQNVWDATMADSIAGALAAGNHPVVQIVGQFHTDHNGGLTERLRSQRPGASVLTVSMVGAAAPESISEDDYGRADVLIYVSE